MIIPPFVGQEGGGGIDIVTLLLPLAICLMCMGQSQGTVSPSSTETESWYTPQGIDDAYAALVAQAEEWRRKAQEAASARSGSIVSRLRGLLGGRRNEPNFVVKEEISPRLYRMDDSTGPVIFEFTPVEQGGTVVKATYESGLKTRVARFKAGQPLKIPAIPVSKECQACGKPVLSDFVVCPYCGEKLIKE